FSNSLLIPTFQNLKILSMLYNNDDNIGSSYLKTVLFPKIEHVDLHIVNINETFLTNLADFVKNNGRTLRVLYIDGYPKDNTCLKELLESIGQTCRNLECLRIFYKNEFGQQLIKIFSNC